MLKQSLESLRHCQQQIEECDREILQQLTLLSEKCPPATSAQAAGPTPAADAAPVPARARPKKRSEQEQAFATYEQLRRERTARMFKVGEQGDMGKHAVRPMQQWFRDLATPIFVKLFANPKASHWMYAYKVEWDRPVMPESSASHNSEKAISTSL